MLMSGGEYAIAFGATFARAQAETNLAQVEIRLQVRQIAVRELRLVTRDCLTAKFVGFAHADVAVGLVRVVVRKRNALNASVKPNPFGQLVPACDKYRIRCKTPDV